MLPAVSSSSRLTRGARIRLRTLVLSSALVAAGIQPVAAQTVDDDDASMAAQQLNLPKDVTVFGQSDPNVRKATAIVNGRIITGTDVDQRLALIITANGGKVSDEEKERLRVQVLRNLIDETLQIQEAAANDIKIAPEEIEQSYQRVAANFRKSPTEFDAYLRSQGSSAASIKRQIEGELAWSRLLRRNIQPFVNVSEDEVKSVIDRLNAAKGSDEYRIGEIYLSATPENQAQIVANARNIIQQIQQGGSFQAYARQFSESTTASVGGDLGFVRLGTLPGQMAEVATKMTPGQLVGPVPIPGGYVIMLLLDKRQVLTADPRDAVLSLKQIAITFPQGTSQDRANERVQEFASAIGTIRGCGDANRVAESVGASVVDNDSITVRDLPPQLQASLMDLQVGQTTPPFGSMEDGVRVLLLCGRDDPEASGEPDFDQIMDRIEEERISKRAQRFLRDLRDDAIIEYN